MGKTRHFGGQGVAFKTGPRLPREEARLLLRFERDGGIGEESSDIYLKRTLIPSDAILINPKRWKWPRSKYPPVHPAAQTLIPNFSHWPSIVFAQLWSSHGPISYSLYLSIRVPLFTVVRVLCLCCRVGKLMENWMLRKALTAVWQED